MAWATEKLDLVSGELRLRSLGPEDAEAVARAILDPGGWAGRVWGIDTPEKIHSMLARQLDSRDRGECSPFVYLVNGEVAGITRFLHLAPQRRGLEIGGTCVAPRWRRTFVNTRVKRLLLAHAFERLEAVRVELRVDAGNHCSQMAVLRLGAVLEGGIRHWQVRADGSVPDGLLYSITSREWPEVRDRLQALAEGREPGASFLPACLESERLRLRLYRLADAPDFLGLARRNRESLVDSFPRAGNLQSVAEAEAYVAKEAHNAAAGTAFFYGVWDKGNGRQIGQLQLKALDWKARSAELGYFLDKNYRGRGLGTELVQLAVRELEENRGFRRLVIRALPTNQASLALARKAGFREEGILRDAFVSGRGEWRSLALMARVAAGPPAGGGCR